MQQGADHVFLVLAIAVGQGGRLQAMREPVDGKAAAIALEQQQVVEHAAGQLAGVGRELFGDQRPVGLRAFAHVAEGGVGDGFGRCVLGLRKSTGQSEVTQDLGADCSVHDTSLIPVGILRIGNIPQSMAQVAFSPWLYGQRPPMPHRPRMRLSSRRV